MLMEPSWFLCIYFHKELSTPERTDSTHIIKVRLQFIRRAFNCHWKLRKSPSKVFPCTDVTVLTIAVL